MTYGDLIDDILMTLGYTHDDALRHRAAVAYNMAIVIDRLKRQRIDKDMMSGMGSRGVTDVATTFILPIMQETYLNGRNYFTLPGDVYDIRVNGGVEYIAYANNSNCDRALKGKRFTLCSPAEVHNLEGDAFQRPSPAVPYYYRARLNNGVDTFSDRVWLLGPGATVEYVEVGLYLTIGDIEDIDPEAQIDLPADMVYLVKRMLLDMERWLLLVPQQRLKSDGRDFAPYQGSQPFQPPKEGSVNDPINRSDT